MTKGTVDANNPDPCDFATNNFQLASEYIVGSGGENLTELDGMGGWVRTNAYAGGQMVATYTSDNQGGTLPPSSDFG